MRPRAVLVAELQKVAEQGSRKFWAFWRGMTQEEKAKLLHGPEENQVAIKPQEEELWQHKDC